MRKIINIKYFSLIWIKKNHNYDITKINTKILKNIPSHIPFLILFTPNFCTNSPMIHLIRFANEDLLFYVVNSLIFTIFKYYYVL